MHRPYQALLLVALGLPACAASKDAADKQFDTMRGEIARLESEQDRLQERLVGLEQAQKEPRAEVAEHAPLQVVVLSPEPEGGGEPPAEPDDDDAPRTILRATGHGDDGSGRGAKAKADGRDRDSEKDYQEALSLARKKMYQRALDAFTAYLVHYPDGAHTENALYWLADAHQGLGDAPRALEQLDALLARFPDGNKTPDALLKVALIARKQGDAPKAKEALERLRSRFPKSDAAHRAPKD